MPKKQTTSPAVVGVTVVLQGDAAAVGSDTLAVTTAELSVTTKATGTPKIKATGEIMAVAAAEGGTSETLAFTAAYTSDADKVKVKTQEFSLEQDDVSYSYSHTTIKVWDSGKTQDPKLSIKTSFKEVDAAAVDLSGNVATAEFSVTAQGPASSADVVSDAFVLQDELSQSTILATGAVDIFF